MSKQTPMMVHPSLEEVISHGTCSMDPILPPAQCESFWHYHEARGWKMGRESMKSWKSAMVVWRNNYLERNGNVQALRERPTPGMDKLIWQKEYERVLERIRVIKAGYSENQSMSQRDREEIQKLVARKKELQGKLGVII